MIMKKISVLENEDIAKDKKLYDLQRSRTSELLELQANGFIEKQKSTL